MSAGVLNKEQIKEYLLESDPPRLKATKGRLCELGRSSIDLPLGDTYYVMHASCRPHPDLAITDFIRCHSKEKKRSLEKKTKFERGKVYLVPLDCQLELPEEVYARCTAKSSIGRLDVLVRLLADHQREFDRVANVKSTNLYVEVVPLTFDVLLSPGTLLSQIRFTRGREELCTVSSEALKHEESPVLVFRDGKPAGFKAPEGDPDALLLTLDLDPNPKLEFVGFAAKRPTRDLHPIDPSVRETTTGDRRYNPKDFWDPVRADTDNKTVHIERDRFYIFRSKERFRIPPHLAVDAQAYSESLGDIRIHYAGFAHPHFGYDRRKGTPLIFEVRGHNMDTILRDGDALAKVYFRRMSEKAKKGKKDQYDAQELKLSGCFKDW